jgi:hypothetical protein
MRALTQWRIIQYLQGTSPSGVMGRPIGPNDGIDHSTLGVQAEYLPHEGTEKSGVG